MPLGPNALFLTTATKTANYTATAEDAVLFGDATSGAIAITLPAAAARAGQVLLVKKVDASVNAVTLQRAGADLIEGLTSIALSVLNATRLLVSDGTSKWHAVSSI